jgi:N-succinyl-L-ornithine transcarbamylase
MKNFTCVHDVHNLQILIDRAHSFKKNPHQYRHAGEGKTLGLIFLNPSLRTRLSTQKAAQLLGMQTLVINANTEGWALEFNDEVIMNGTTVEHIRDAAPVLGAYCDMIAVRCFPSLTDKQLDDSEHILVQFLRHCGVPVISLESATRHPLQSLADLITIEEHKKRNRPKVVLTWAPHIKALPQAVANSFSEWMMAADYDLHIACPKGLELNPEFTANTIITHNQREALDNADFVYVKNWSSWQEYGKPVSGNQDWMLTDEKLAITNNAYIMHCLPVRREVELSSTLIEGPRSLLTIQAANRVPAAQAVLFSLLQQNATPAASEHKKEIA